MKKPFSRTRISSLVGMFVVGGGALLLAQHAAAFTLTINDTTNGSTSCTGNSVSVDGNGNVTIGSTGCEIGGGTGQTTTTTTTGTGTTTSTATTTTTGTTTTTATTTSTTTTTANPNPTGAPTTTCSDPIANGVDRGCQTWTPSDADVTVFTANRTSNRNYIPGCVTFPDTAPTTSFCRTTGSGVDANEIYSMRILHIGNVPTSSFEARNGVDNATFAFFDGAISDQPGVKTPLGNQSKCGWLQADNKSNVTYADENNTSRWTAYKTCELQAGKVYYLNVWPSPVTDSSGATGADCGTSQNCRVEINNNAFSHNYDDGYLDDNPLTNNPSTADETLLPNYF